MATSAKQGAHTAQLQLIHFYEPRILAAGASDRAAWCFAASLAQLADLVLVQAFLTRPATGEWPTRWDVLRCQVRLRRLQRHLRSAAWPAASGEQPADPTVNWTHVQAVLPPVLAVVEYLLAM